MRESHVVLLGAVLIFVVASCTSSLTSPSAVAGTLQVRDVRVIVTAPRPAQVTLQVDGVLPDACTSVGRVSQAREGGAIIVTIMTDRSGDICAQVIQNVTVPVTLNGTFVAGTYTVRVNGVERTVTV
ncbi:MAG: hypothetical protein ABL971_10865 [Vicinamibacterales bacterium]